MTNSNTVKVFAPATVANVSCAFDILGFAIDDVGDEIICRRTSNIGKVTISKIISPYAQLSTDTKNNTASVAVLALLNEIETDCGIDIEIEKKMPIGSGMGSSAASAAGAVFATNVLLGSPFTKEQLVKFAMKGEFVASGAIHADNVAPSLLGGFTLVRSNDPLDIISVNYPENLYVSVVCPNIEVKTSDSRSVLKKQISLSVAVKQFGNIAGLIAGLEKRDCGLISRSLTDYIIEPERAILIPGFYDIKSSAISAGALGAGISGSGPSIFALSDNRKIALNISEVMREKFKQINIESFVIVSKINQKGCHIIS
jgi:homoserine kinase